MMSRPGTDFEFEFDVHRGTYNIKRNFKTKPAYATYAIFVAFLLLMLVYPVSAQITAYVKFAPLYPLPGDHVRGEVVIEAGALPVKITGITFVSSLNINPKDVSGIGVIPAGSTYKLPFTLIAPSPGTYTVKVYIYQENGTLVKTFNLDVVNTKPEIVITTPITLKEVNEVHFSVYNPINAVDVKVIPLFKAYPSEISVVNNQGSFEFYPVKEKPLKFRIEFYNAFADNYHSYVQVVNPAYKVSEGVNVNVSTPHTYYLLYDVIPVEVQISNLRGDTVYSVSIKIQTNKFNKTVYIPSIQSGGVKLVEIDCPAVIKSNRSSSYNENEVIQVVVVYRDSLGNTYNIKKDLIVGVVDKSTVSVSDISVSNSTNGFEITGDVSNSGWSKVYSVVVTAVGDKNKSYFVGTIDPSDYDTFDIVTSNVSKIVVTWQNVLGETFSVSKSLKLHRSVVRIKENNTPILVSIVAVVVVLLIVSVAVYKSKTRK